MKFLFGPIFFVALCANQSVHAFPEMVRHAYTNCIACHVSPNGGGVLTEYGRELSKEALSTWGWDGEQNFLYAFKQPEWLKLGGDVRAVQIYQNTPRVREGRTIWMQSDFEYATTYQKLTWVQTLGYREVAQPGADKKSEFISRRFYLNFRPTDETSFRVGKFMPQIGINTPEHNLVIKDGLGWNQSRDITGETFNTEFAWLGEKLNTFVTAILGRPDRPDLNRETGIAAEVSWVFSDTYKVGVNYFWGTNKNVSRQFMGPFGILGFRKDFFLLTQFDYQRSNPPGLTDNSTDSFVGYNRLDYEIFQGFHVYGSHQYSQTDFKNPQSVFQGYGLGFQFFPRPHFDFQALWEKQQLLQLNQGVTDFAWLMMHYYL